MTHPIDALFQVIADRRGSDPERSYTARLFERGTPTIARKVGEEAVETVIEALAGSKQTLTASPIVRLSESVRPAPKASPAPTRLLATSAPARWLPHNSPARQVMFEPKSKQRN